MEFILLWCARADAPGIAVKESSAPSATPRSLFGHPLGLFSLFFTEMFERLAFYTMLNVLFLYATDAESGGLGLTTTDGSAVVGAYLAFVYLTPFPGGIIADRFIGYRKAVLIGGFTMAIGLFSMSTPGSNFFIVGLILLCVGNGFLKPNISVMVGHLYKAGDAKRDAGFNIFYMGINIGAFVASYLSSYMRGNHGWLWTFRAAGIGLIVGMVVLLVSWKLLAEADRRPERDPDDVSVATIVLKIFLPAGVAGTVGYVAASFFPDLPVSPTDVGFLCAMIPVVLFFVRLATGAKPSERSGLLALLPIYVAGGTFFMILHLNSTAMTQWAQDSTARTEQMWPFSEFEQDAYPSYYGNAAEDVPRPNRATLLPVESAAVAREFGQRMVPQDVLRALEEAHGDVRVVSFESDAKPSGSDAALLAVASKVYEKGVVSVKEGKGSHGESVVTVSVPDDARPTGLVTLVRETDGITHPVHVVSQVQYDAIYGGYEERFGHPPTELKPGEWVRVAGAELYQSFNALFVVLFTPILVFIFGWLVARKRGITTARKIFLGLSLTTVSLLLMAVAGLASEGGLIKVSSLYLVGFYGIITIGELCLSPIGLSLVTKLTPKRLVGLTMGGWFLATAIGNKFSGFFGGIQGSMDPVSFFLLLAGLAATSALFIRLLLPRLDAAIKECGG